jgi:hypothetical protein
VNDTLLGLPDLNLGTLEPGNCRSVELNYTVTAEDACSGWVNNTVNVSAVDSCGETIYAEDAWWNETNIEYNATINVTKTADIYGPVSPGDTINYTITVCNTGYVTISYVTINDALLGTFNTTNLSKGECWMLNKTYNVTPADCTGWINNTVYVNGADYCGKNVTGASASWNIMVECGYCISGYKLNASSGSGLANWTINVTNSTGAVVATATTDETGYWQVCGLTPGNYTACEELLPGWVAVDPASGCHENITLNDTDRTNVNFTNREEVFCIFGYKLNKISGLGVAGWAINVKNSTGAIVATTATDKGGYWQVCGLAPGNYTVCEVLQPGWRIIEPEFGCQNVSLGAVNITDLNFTNCECNGSISNYVWLDANQNGIQDVNESGLGGVTVRLYRHESPGTLCGTTVTNGIGFYIFDKLCAGNYSLEFIPPPGFLFTPKNQGNSTEEDSDVDPATRRTDVFYLGSGEFDTTIDAGLYQVQQQVPALTPSGLVALVSSLATIAALNIRRKRRR